VRVPMQLPRLSQLVNIAPLTLLSQLYAQRPPSAEALTPKSSVEREEEPALRL